jgi:hypothetical protein
MEAIMSEGDYRHAAQLLSFRRRRESETKAAKERARRRVGERAQVEHNERLLTATRLLHDASQRLQEVPPENPRGVIRDLDAIASNHATSYQCEIRARAEALVLAIEAGPRSPS